MSKYLDRKTRGGQEHEVSKGGSEQGAAAGLGWRGGTCVGMHPSPVEHCAAGRQHSPAQVQQHNPSASLTCSCRVRGRPPRRGPAQSRAAGRRQGRTGRRLCRRRGQAGPEPDRKGKWGRRDGERVQMGGQVWQVGALSGVDAVAAEDRVGDVTPRSNSRRHQRLAALPPPAPAPTLKRSGMRPSWKVASSTWS